MPRGISARLHSPTMQDVPLNLAPGQEVRLRYPARVRADRWSDLWARVLPEVGMLSYAVMPASSTFSLCE